MVRLKGLSKLKQLNDLIGNRTRYVISVTDPYGSILGFLDF
jgi:hypothetical protein